MGCDEVFSVQFIDVFEEPATANIRFQDYTKQVNSKNQRVHKNIDNFNENDT